MIDYDLFDRYGIMPEIPTPSDPNDEPTENDIADAHLFGCLYAIAASVVLFIAVCLIILIKHL